LPFPFTFLTGTFQGMSQSVRMVEKLRVVAAFDTNVTATDWVVGVPPYPGYLPVGDGDQNPAFGVASLTNCSNNLIQESPS